MGNGYLWASMLKTSAFFGVGMFTAILILFIFVRRNNGESRTAAVVVITLAVGLISGSCWLLFQGTLSNERNVLDRVDHQIMYIVDRQSRACILLGSLPNSRENDRKHFEQTLDASRDYLRELEHPVVLLKDLDWLSAKFHVGESPGLSKAELLGYELGGLLGLFFATVAALLVSGYLILRTFFDSEKAADFGILMTGAVLLGSFFILTAMTHSESPLVLTLIIPAATAILLHRCSRRKSLTPLKITSTILLLLSVALYAVSSWAIVTAGENKLRNHLTVMNTHLPNVVQRAKTLGKTLDRLRETGRFDEGVNAKSVCYGLYIEIGSLEERLGNLDPQAENPDDVRDFDPYRAEFTLFLQNVQDWRARSKQ